MKEVVKKKYWVVNGSKKDAVSAVKKLTEGIKGNFDVIELTDSEYHILSNPEACRYISEEVE